MDNYKAAISQLTSLEKFHINLGLDRVQALLELFGNPQDSLKCIHVAGTNGKGSTCAMLESVLREAGYKTGLYTSPHLVDYTERIKVNGQDISQDEFAEIILRVIEHTEPQNIVHYDTKEFPNFDENKSKFNREILSYYKKNFQGRSVHHKILGEIKFFDAGIRKTIHVNNIEDLKLIIKLDKLVEYGKYRKTEFSYKKRIDGIIKFHTLQTVIKIDNSFKTLAIKIGEDKRGNKFYFYKEQSLGILPGKTGITEASNCIITNENAFFNPAYKTQNAGILPGKAGITEALEVIITDNKQGCNYAYPTTKIPATEFEILTVAAFLYFREKGVDFAVMETGLGGRLDATNVIKKPELCVITDIGLDHTARLGETVEEIAAEKAGIIKEAAPVVTLKDNAGLAVIKNKAESCNSRLVLVDELDADPSEVALKGLWQRRNLSLVKAGLALLREAGANIPVDAEKRGLQNVQWRGRFEYIKEANLLIDSAHNPPGANVLRASLDEHFPEKGRVFVYSSLTTKDFRTVSKILFRREDVVIVTRNTGHACELPEVIASFLKENRLCREVYSIEHVIEAMELSRKLRNNNDLIVFTGSIYTIGEFLAAKDER